MPRKPSNTDKPNGKNKSSIQKKKPLKSSNSKKRIKHLLLEQKSLNKLKRNKAFLNLTRINLKNILP